MANGPSGTQDGYLVNYDIALRDEPLGLSLLLPAYLTNLSVVGT